MIKNKQTPSQGLKILENLHEKFPKNQQIIRSLIDGYIKLGIHDTAINMITSSPIKNLRHKAWLAHKNNDINQEREIWQEILLKQYFATIDGNFKLIQRSKKEIKIQSNDIPLLCMVHNEMLRLPFFLEYYRDLGITQFIFIDNNSNDSSLEFLLQQPDCHVFWTNDSHNQAGAGMAWIHHLINIYLLPNQWFIHSDADEFLVYPNCEYIKLPQLIQYMNNFDFEAMPGFMLDMFPKKISKFSNQNFNTIFDTSPYFYNNYQKFYQNTSPYINISGGIRCFLFQEHNTYMVKITFIKNIPNLKFLSSAHQSTPLKVANITSSFLHFKFIGDFHNYVKEEIFRKQHTMIRYNAYYAWGLKNIDFDFTKLDKTTKYQNSQQLVELGLIKTSEEWEKFCESQ